MNLWCCLPGDQSADYQWNSSRMLSENRCKTQSQIFPMITKCRNDNEQQQGTVREPVDGMWIFRQQPYEYVYTILSKQGKSQCWDRKKKTSLNSAPISSPMVNWSAIIWLSWRNQRKVWNRSHNLQATEAWDHRLKKTDSCWWFRKGVRSWI